MADNLPRYSYRIIWSTAATEWTADSSEWRFLTGSGATPAEAIADLDMVIASSIDICKVTAGICHNRFIMRIVTMPTTMTADRLMDIARSKDKWTMLAMLFQRMLEDLGQNVVDLVELDKDEIAKRLIELSQKPPHRNAYGLVAHQWDECVAGFRCRCGHEIVVSDEPVRCDCGRKYWIYCTLLVEEANGPKTNV